VFKVLGLGPSSPSIDISPWWWRVFTWVDVPSGPKGLNTCSNQYIVQVACVVN
jgi:hypothetical protein